MEVSNQIGGRMIETTPVRKEVRIQFLQDTKQTMTTKFAVGDRVVTEVLGNNLFIPGCLELLTFDAFWIQAREGEEGAFDSQ